jgi:hypothetical protein
MIKTLFLVLLLFLTVQPAMGQDNTGCHFNTERAIICAGPRNAALAFQYFGYDADPDGSSINREILKGLGCSIPFREDYQSVDIRQIRAEIVHMPSRTEPVILAVFNGKSRGYFAQRYVFGTCNKSRTGIDEE